MFPRFIQVFPVKEVYIGSWVYQDIQLNPIEIPSCNSVGAVLFPLHHIVFVPLPQGKLSHSNGSAWTHTF